MNKQIVKNLTTNILSIGLVMLINLITMPIITGALGMGAYSFVGIITNIVNCIAVITNALNSMVGRFYTLAYRESRSQDATEYISSAFAACLGLCALLLPLIFGAAFGLEHLIKIPEALVWDVKIAFVISCSAFLLSTISAVMSTGSYCKNRLDIMNLINILANLIGAGLTFTLFLRFAPKIWYVGLVTFVQTAINLLLGYVSFKRLIPETKFSLRYFRGAKVKELLSAGFYSSVIMLGTTLMSQIDLLIGNRFLNEEIVGMYTVILFFPNTIKTIAAAISNSFSPTTLAIYAKSKLEGLREYSNKVVKYCGLILGWPISIMACMGVPFIGIWMGRDFTDYRWIVLASMLPLVANLAVLQLNVVNQAINKLKIPAIASVAAGVLNLALALAFTGWLGMGLWGIVIASVLSFSLRNFVFMPIYASVITKQHWFAYYKGILSPAVLSCLVCALGLAVELLWPVRTVLPLVAVCAGLSAVYAAGALLALGREERAGILGFLKRGRGKEDL